MKLTKTCLLGVALGTMAMAGMSRAADAPMAAPMMAPSTAPMPVSGTVLRYYVDRSGYVSAMDVQTADGVKMVRFSPGMAQSLTTMFPVGSTANVFVTSSMMGMKTNYYLAGTGPAMPTPAMMAMMAPMTVTDLDVLRSQPYVMLGSKQKVYKGNLKAYVPDPRTGEVLAIVLSNGDQQTLVRVPRENRLLPSGMYSERVVPLTKGAKVIVFGMDEAPRYGVLSPYAEHVVASGIAVDGNTLGALGFGKVKSAKSSTLIGFDLNLGGFLGGNSPDEVQASKMGYSTYMAPAPAAPMAAPAS